VAVDGQVALVFDCDGTLADTDRYGHLPAFNQTFAEFGLPVRWTEEQYGEKLRIGGGKERMASLLTAEFVAEAGLPTDPEGQTAAVATSVGCDSRPRGIVAMNWARRSGVSSPMNFSSNPVSPATGLMTFTRMLSPASSAAIERDVTIAAPLLPLYHVSPGRGRTPAVDAIVTKTPLRCARKCGTACFAVR